MKLVLELSGQEKVKNWGNKLPPVPKTYESVIT